MIAGVGGYFLWGVMAHEEESAYAPPRDSDLQVTGPARKLFQEALPEYIIALNRWINSEEAQAGVDDELQALRATLITALHKASLDDSLSGAFENLIDATIYAAKVEESELDDAADSVVKKTLLLNDAIASAGLGFLVEADIQTHSSGRRFIILLSFEVARVVLYRSGGHDVRTLRVNRLDNLDFTYNLLGFTSSRRKDAVVLVDMVEEHVLQLLPALDEEAIMDPFRLSKKDSETEWFNPLRRLATAIIREELGSAGGEELQTLGALLATRREIYARWDERLETRRASTPEPTGLDIKWKYAEQMEGLVTNAAIRELDGIQEKLRKKDMREAFYKARDHFAQSVDRHETQHRLDYAKLYKLPMPPALALYVGDLPDGLAGQGNRASSALAEMSAYLSELARDPLTPKINLTLLVRYLLDKGAWGMSESYAALVIVEGLADELGIEHGSFVVGRSIQRSTVAAVYTKMCEVESEAFRSAAKALWAKFFGLELPVLELISR
jgi:hypothetical protein